MGKQFIGDKTNNLNNKHYYIPGLKGFERIIDRMCLTEKLIFIALLILTSVGAGILLWNAQSSMLVTVPAHNGALKEGIVGTPGPINPILASSVPDRTLTGLIYSGLMKASPEGKLKNELCEKYVVSESGKEYIFKLRKGALFHDGEVVTAEDIIFTVEKIKDPAVKSTLAADWAGIEVESIDSHTVKFTLSEPKSSFLELVTIGILPKHLWKTVDSNRFYFSRLNIEPVGSGPYQISSVSYKETTPTEYRLKAFKNYVKEEPYITNLVFSFFHEEREAWTALQKGEINALAGFSPQRMDTTIKEGITIKTTPLPRVFAIFLNQNNNDALADVDVRHALSKAINRDEVLSETINGKGSVVTGPLPPNAFRNKDGDINIKENSQLTPKELLNKAGWKYDEELMRFTKNGSVLSVDISTVTNSELQKAAEVIKNNWENIGVETTVSLYGNSELNQNILRPRNFEGLLFGYILDRNFDLFPFWHSSERNDPGMNLSIYTNLTVDEMLEKYQKEEEAKKRVSLLENIDENIKTDIPAFFLYSPHFLYALPEKVQNISIGHITAPEDRFLNIHEWFIETDSVWEFLL